jgi:predicted dehydrogenase
MSDKLRVAVVGTGNWGLNHVRTFAASAQCQVSFLADINYQNLTRARRFAPEAEMLSDHRPLLERKDCEAVVVATPAETHYEIARDFLQAGKHVLVEKPLTLKVEHARELVELEQAGKAKLMTGHLLLYHPAVRYLKECLTRGDLGRVYYIYSSRVNLGAVRRNENTLWSFAPHDISVMMYLLDQMPEAGQTVARSYLQPGVPDVAFFTLFFPNDVMAHGQVSWLDPHKIRKLTVVGEKKMAVFDDMESSEKIRIYDKGVNRMPSYDSYGDLLTLRQGDIHLPFMKMTEPLRVECDHFLTCIRENKPPLTDGRNGLTVVRILNALEESLARESATVKIEVPA